VRPQASANDADEESNSFQTPLRQQSPPKREIRSKSSKQRNEGASISPPANNEENLKYKIREYQDREKNYEK